MAVADGLLRDGAAGGGSFLGQHGGWLILIGIVLVAVAVMLLILAGRYRNRSEEYSSLQDPLFDADGDADEYGSPFAEVVIEDEAPAPGFAQVMETERDDDHVDDGVADYEDEPEPAVAHSTDYHEPDEPEDPEPHPNVVPLRVAPEEQRTAAQASPDVEEENDEEEYEQETPAPRYAFATGRAAAAEASFSQTGRTDRHDEDRVTTQATASGDDRDRPYVAPFIRDDIERSERRQSDRIDRIRDDFSSQIETLKAEQSSRLDLVIAAIDRKLDSLDRRRAESYSPAPVSSGSSEQSRDFLSLQDQVQRISASIDGQGQRIRAITQILETKFAEVGRVYDEVKTVHEEIKSARSDLGQTGAAVGDVRGDLDEVKEHVGRLERAILDRAAQESSTTVRLADVVRGTLPDGSFEFGATLANGETADCLIRFDGIRHRIAIDSGFPMEAFHELPSRDAVRRNLPQAKAAEDGFRRAILRSILEAADRCISPDETADSCLLFLPSEAAYTILHDRFPDLVRDSQRAKVWLVSPSTLMGTLHLVKSLLPDGGELSRREAEMDSIRARRDEDDRLREEVEALRKRASTLSEELERTRGTLRGLIAPSQNDDIASGVPSHLRPRPEATEQNVQWGAASNEQPRQNYPTTSMPRDAERADDDEIIESLSFEGTPDWQSPLGREVPGNGNPYNPSREDRLR